MIPGKKEKQIEWACRILLTLQIWTLVGGYVLIQMKYQLVSPSIPPSIPYDISHPYIISSLTAGVLFLITLWLYFFLRKIAVIVLATVSILFYQLFLYAS